MGNLLLLFVIALTVGAVVFGVMTLVTGSDPGLQPAEPDERATPLPGDRPLVEHDVTRATFDITWRGYRMAQVDQTLRRLAYDTGYKNELIQVLEAEVIALREGRLEDADTLAATRVAAISHGVATVDAPADSADIELDLNEAAGAEPAVSVEQPVAVEAIAGEPAAAGGRPEAAAGGKPAALSGESQQEAERLPADTTGAAPAAFEPDHEADTDQPPVAVDAPASGRR